MPSEGPDESSSTLLCRVRNCADLGLMRPFRCTLLLVPRTHGISLFVPSSSSARRTFVSFAFTARHTQNAQGCNRSNRSRTVSIAHVCSGQTGDIYD